MRSLAVLLAGCGRLGFEAGCQPGDAPTAPPDADPTSFCAIAQTAPSTVHIRGTAFRYTSFDNERMPLANAMIAAMAASTTSAADGAYDLAIDTGGAPLVPLVVRYTFGTDFATDVHYDIPVERDITGPNGDVLSLGDGPIWNAGQMNSIYSAASLVRDPTRGFISVAVRDCVGAPIAGAKVDVEPLPEAVVYQADDGRPADVGETQPRYGQAFAMNAQAGPTTIHVTHPAHTFADVSITVLPGAVNTLVVARTME
ncbi:MAG: hypothetical protein AB7T06_26500 [Kofleriaceae bacterium]